MSNEASINATTDELEELNGLLVRGLIEKIKEGTANATDLTTAAKVIISNRVKPTDPELEAIRDINTIDPMDFPVQL